jgi:hypothetical protein
MDPPLVGVMTYDVHNRYDMWKQQRHYEQQAALHDQILFRSLNVVIDIDVMEDGIDPHTPGGRRKDPDIQTSPGVSHFNLNFDLE